MTVRAGLQHPLVIVVSIGIVILLGLAALPEAPAWEIRAFALDRTIKELVAKSWSPDGTRLITDWADRYEVVGYDGSVELHDRSGWSPVWTDDRTLLVLVHIDEESNQLVRVDVASGHQQAIGLPLPLGILHADASGHVALETVTGPRTIFVIDPRTGRVLDELVGFRAWQWSSDGALIVTRDLPGRRVSPFGGTFLIWTPGGRPHRLAPDLFEETDSAVLSPDGNSVACVCFSTSSPEHRWPGVYRFALDGSAGRELMQWPVEPSRQTPVVAWFDNETIAVLDEHRLTRISGDGDVRTLLELPPVVYPGRMHSSARLYALDRAVAVVTRVPMATESVLMVVDDMGHVRVSRRFPGLNLSSLVADGSPNRALIDTGPQAAGGPAPMFLLERGEFVPLHRLTPRELAVR